MSELSDSFKKANLVFTHASNSIVSLYEGAVMMAEDMSDEIARKRKLYQARGVERTEIEDEIRAGVAFFDKMLPAFFIVQNSLLEDCLAEICEIVARTKQIELELNQPGRFTTDEAKSFLETKAGIQLPSPWPAWEKVQELQRMRDGIVNHTGPGFGSFEVSDHFLVEMNQTIILFFKELQSFLPDMTA